MALDRNKALTRKGFCLFLEGDDHGVATLFVSASWTPHMSCLVNLLLGPFLPKGQVDGPADVVGELLPTCRTRHINTFWWRRHGGWSPFIASASLTEGLIAAR